MAMMRCGGCGAENREGAKFCGECGTRLERRCRECDLPLAEGLRFCDECGTPVAEAEPAGESVAGGAARKSVTVAFVDLGGSTAFGEAVDAETARSVMGRYHSLVTEAVDAHRGTVAKYIGDGVMVFFGVPEIAEDDAVRAVAFGADVQERFAPFADRVLARHGATVTLRVGINTGEIVIGDDDVDLYGDALNVAARLEKACPNGGVLVGEETWRLARNGFAFEAQGEVDVHGRSEAVRPYLLVLDAQVAEQTAPFVGRDDELGRLQRLFTRTVADRRPTLASVVGPPGVGKSRLSRELHALVEQESAAVYTTTCDRHGDATFGPIADLLRPDDAAGSDTVRSGLMELFDGDPDAPRVVEGLLAILGSASKKVSVEETFWSVRRLVERLGRDAPVVVVVDDIQWASEQLLDLFEHLVSFVADTALLLVTLARPEIRELRPVFAEAGRPVDELVLLTGLDPDATATLAARLLGADELPRGLAERLPASTDGNPLFVREVVRMLVDEEVIRADGGRWALTVEPDAIDVPPTIQSLLAARVERLPAEERTVLERASVIGPDFTRGGLEHLCTAIERTALPQVLRSLTRRELVEATGSYWGDDPVHRFHHVLIRDAVYRRLLKENRAELHERIGAWMADASTEVLGDHEAAIGHHFEQAFHYRADLGDDDTDLHALGDRAAQLLSDAATVALRDDDTVAAAGLARRALACLATDAPTRPSALTQACEALLDLGDAAAARPFIDELLALAELSPVFAGWAKAYDAQAITIAEPDRLADAETLATDAVEAMADLADPTGRAKARLVRAAILARRGRIGECEAELDIALTEARAAADTRRVVAVLGVAPLAALWGPSPVARAGGRCLDVLRLLRITASSPSVEAVALRCQAVLEALRGRSETALSLIERAQGSIEELGLRRELADIAMARGQIHLLAGDALSAESPLRTAHEELHAINAGAEASQAAALLGRTLLRLGRADEVEPLVDEAERLAGENLKAAILGRTVRAEWLLATGRSDQARTVAERAVAIAETTDLILDHAEACDVLAAAGGSPSTTAAELRERKGVSAIANETGGGGSAMTESTPKVSYAAAPPPSDELRGQQRPGDESSVPASVEQVMARMADAWRSGDRDGWASNFVEVPELGVARAVGGPSAGGEAALETMWSLRDLLPEAEMRIESTSDGVARAWARFHDDAGNEVEMRIVVELDDRVLVERLTTFDGDDRAGAEALYRQRVEERASRSDDAFDRIDFVVPELRRVVENTPYGRTVAAGARAWTTGDDEHLAWLFGRDDVVIENRKSTVNSGTTIGSEAAGVMVTTRAFFPEVERVEILAVRGARFGVSSGAYSGDDAVEEFLLVIEADRGGRIVRQVVLDPDALAEADALLDEWFWSSDEAVFERQMSVGRRLMDAQHDPSRRGDLLDVLSEDFTYRYPSVLGDRTFGRDEYIDLVRSFMNTDDHEVEEWQAWAVWGEPLSERVLLSVVRRRARIADGTTPEWLWVGVIEICDGQIRRFELLPIEELEHARRLALEWNGAGAFGGLPAPLVGVPFVDFNHWNEAVRWRLRVLAFYNDRDRDPTTRLARDDARILDRRPLGRSEFTGLQELWEYSATLLELAEEQVDSGSARPEPFRLSGVVAVEGERFCLTAEFIDGHADNLHVVEIDDDGLLVRTATYEPEQLDEARATLAEWHAEASSPTSDDPLDRCDFAVPALREVFDGTRAATTLCRIVRALVDRDEAMLRDVYGRDDVMQEPHVSGPHAGRLVGPDVADAFVVGTSVFWRLDQLEVLAVRGTDHMAVRLLLSDGEGNEFESIFVIECDREGRVVRQASFDRGAIQPAVDLLDEWYLSEDAVGRDVHVVGTRLLDLMHAEDRHDEQLGLFADGATIRVPLFTLDDLAADDFWAVNQALAAEATAVDAWVVWDEPLSEHVLCAGARRVATMPDGTRAEWFWAAVVEAHDGRVHALTVYEIEDLDTAREMARQLNGLGAFGEAPAALADAPTVEWPDWNDAVRYRLSVNHLLNGHGVGRTPRPDAVIEDHRPLNRTRVEGPKAIWEFATSLRDTVQLSIEAGSSPIDPFRLCRVLAVDGDRRCLTADCGIGVADYLTVTEIDGDGAMALQAYYVPEQFDQALADFRSLATPSVDHRVTDPLDRVDFVVPELREVMEGTPFARMADFLDAYAAGDEATMAWFYGRDDLVNENRMSTLNSGQSTGADVLDILLATNQFLPNVNRSEVLAVRGTRFGASRTSFGDEDGNRYDFLSVQEVADDGRLVRQVVLDDDALTEAVELLDEWYASSPDAVGRDMTLAGSMILRSANEPALRAEALDRLDPDVRFHQNSGSTLLDDLGRDDFFAMQDALAVDAERVAYWMVWGEPYSESVSFALIRRIATMRGGSTVEWVYATANVYRDGRLLLVENFDGAELERARRRTAELAAVDDAWPADPPLPLRPHRIATTHHGGTPHLSTEFPGAAPSLALREVNDHLRFMHDQRAAGVRDLRVVGPTRDRMAPDFQRIDHRPLGTDVLDGDEAERSTQILADLGFVIAGAVPVAGRGEHQTLGIVSVQSDDNEMLSGVGQQFRPDGLMSVFDVFDPSDTLGAYHRMLDRYLADADDDADAGWVAIDRAFVDALAVGDRAALRAIFTDDLHATLDDGTELDADGYTAAHLAFRDEVPGAVTWIAQIRVDGNRAIGELATADLTVGLDGQEWFQYVVWERVDGRVTSAEHHFDVRTALARFERHGPVDAR